jgi:hypothetical protein
MSRHFSIPLLYILYFSAFILFNVCPYGWQLYIRKRDEQIIVLINV